MFQHTEVINSEKIGKRCLWLRKKTRSYKYRVPKKTRSYKHRVP